MAKLTEKQQRFVDEYLIDLNATQAAIRAGYSVKTANEQGCQNLAKLSIQQAIAEQMAERSKRTGVNQDRVVLELAKIAFVKITDIVDSHGKIRDTATADDLACIESIKYKSSESDTGSRTQGIPTNGENAITPPAAIYLLSGDFSLQIPTEIRHKPHIAHLILLPFSLYVGICWIYEAIRGVEILSLWTLVGSACYSCQ